MLASTILLFGTLLMPREHMIHKKIVISVIVEGIIGKPSILKDPLCYGEGCGSTSSCCAN